MKKYFALALALILALSLVACSKPAEPAAPGSEGPSEPAPAEVVTIKVGATPAPHCDILEVAKDAMPEGYELEIVEFNDYVVPNTAVQEGELDANYFQHITYMNSFNAEHGTDLVSVAGIHYEPFGLYAGKTAAIADLPAGAKIAVPNDPSNEARALLLLQQEGFLKLKDGVGIDATKDDIVEYTKDIEIVEVEAQMLPNTLQDVDMAVINGNYAIDAGLKVSDAVAVEKKDGAAADAYQNILTVKAGNESNEGILALAEALQSDAVKSYIEKTYDGAVVALF